MDINFMIDFVYAVFACIGAYNVGYYLAGLIRRKGK